MHCFTLASNRFFSIPLYNEAPPLNLNLIFFDFIYVSFIFFVKSKPPSLFSWERNSIRGFVHLSVRRSILPWVHPWVPQAFLKNREFKWIQINSRQFKKIQEGKNSKREFLISFLIYIFRCFQTSNTFIMPLQRQLNFHSNLYIRRNRIIKLHDCMRISICAIAR